MASLPKSVFAVIANLNGVKSGPEIGKMLSTALTDVDPAKIIERISNLLKPKKK